MRKPDFDNILKVLDQKKPSRSTLFEYYMNDTVYDAYAGKTLSEAERKDPFIYGKHLIRAFQNAGYDYAHMTGSKFQFQYGHVETAQTRSLNAGFMIVDEESYENYRWNDPENYDYSHLKALEKELPDGMKLIVSAGESVFGGAARLIGYDNLCYMLYDDRDLVKEIWQQIGSRMLKYNQIISQFDSVGAVIVNDDWGFNTQTMISPDDMREFVFPWHKKIVETIHAAGKPAILHSCGNLSAVFNDIVDDMHYDGKHSYQDNICPVEEMYDRWHDKIGIMGGLDVDFLCRSTPEEVRNRSIKMLEKSADLGGFALGSGNSIADFVPIENYRAMIEAIQVV